MTYLVDELGLPSWLRSIERWLAVDFVQILVWIVGAVLVARFIRWGANRYAQHAMAQFERSDDIVQSEDLKHRRALVDVVAWTLIAIVGIIVGLKMMALWVPTSSLVGLSAVLGAALGFGAQRVVQDVLAGFFIIAEHQYGYGDVVNLAVTGGLEAEGTVEDVTLRVTRLRNSDGELITVPNGQMIKATNLSKDWARAVVDVPVPMEADINVVNATLREVGQSFYDDPRWHRLLLDAPQPLGVTKLELDSATVRMMARTLPGQQFDIGRALRSAIVAGLARHGVSVARTIQNQTVTETVADTAPDGDVE
ncbi:mechanosensitive ion channel family protein [Gordonia sp. HY002]|uniref:mechanosensitive ion channel family protein n=1 Tax=Gordonia zhenghanii TaxID=2911516 RepID=UPI001EEFB5EC|nr:mechanosensitive ion channel family protein [Gordonia zhenghanii]MCF8571218.1 mechanosensitive ion channel family protein [Gordonia zhenghanii]MCF8601742.1 mechanosensitive ion channel family protein [Gordonia zhenghanii]